MPNTTIISGRFRLETLLVESIWYPAPNLLSSWAKNQKKPKSIRSTDQRGLFRSAEVHEMACLLSKTEAPTLRSQADALARIFPVAAEPQPTDRAVAKPSRSGWRAQNRWNSPTRCLGNIAAADSPDTAAVQKILARREDLDG